MSSVTNVASDETIAKDAYARVKADLAALASDQLLQVNLEPYFAADAVLGAWVRLKNFRDEIAKLPGVNVAMVDKLQDYVLALRYVHGQYVMATKPSNNMEQLVEEANKLNDILEADARALALRGLFDGGKLERLTGGNSYKGLADDLEALASALEAVFPQIEGKTGITREDLKAATQMATRLTRLRGEDQLAPEVVAEVTEERQRAFTQLIKAYDEARAAVAFLAARGRRGADRAERVPREHAAPKGAGAGDCQATHDFARCSAAHRDRTGHGHEHDDLRNWLARLRAGDADDAHHVQPVHDLSRRRHRAR